MATFIVAFCYVLNCSGQTNTIVLDSKSGADCVWINSSAPPATKGDDRIHPQWKRASTVNDSSLGEKSLPSINNMWYPLSERTTDLRIGGWGDQYVGFLHAPVPQSPTTYKRVVLRLFFEKEGQAKLPSEIEIRAVTSADPLPIQKKEGESWTPERIRFSMQPASRFLCHVPVKAGWVEVDVTGWANSGSTLHGLRFSDTDGPDERYVRIHGPASKNPPQLVLEK